MTLATVVAMAMFLGVVVYALFAGADFGSGFYDLTAGSGERGSEIRTLVDTSIGPVWEANHVWLIYILVMWWTGFPGHLRRGDHDVVHSAVSGSGRNRVARSQLCLPQVLRDVRPGTAVRRDLCGVVGDHSVLPRRSGRGDRFRAGCLPTGTAISSARGSIRRRWWAVVSRSRRAVFLAGVFLTADAARAGSVELAERLRKRTLGVGVVAGIIVFAGLYPVAHDAPTLSHGLRTAASPLLVVAAAAGIATLVLLYRRKFSPARVSAVAAVASVVTGWGVGQYPWLLVDQVTIDEGAGADATLTGLLVVVVLAGVIVLPALTYLFRLTQQWTRT